MICCWSEASKYGCIDGCLSGWQCAEWPNMQLLTMNGMMIMHRYAVHIWSEKSGLLVLMAPEGSTFCHPSWGSES